MCLFPTVECNFLFQAILYDDKGSKIDALHVRASDVVTGEQLESDRSESSALTLSREQKTKTCCPAPKQLQSSRPLMAAISLPPNSYNLLAPKWLQSSRPLMATISLSPNSYNLLAPKQLQSSRPLMAAISLPPNSYNLLAPKWLQSSHPQMATIFPAPKRLQSSLPPNGYNLPAS